MSYDELLRQGRIRPQKVSPQEVQQLLQVAARDLETAATLVPENLDWAFNIVYNAMLQAARALMLHEGYRSRGQGQHMTTVRFCEIALGSAYKRELSLLDQMRRKRHRLVYERVGLVSRQEVEQALDFARGFVVQIREVIASPH